MTRPDAALSLRLASVPMVTTCIMVVAVRSREAGV
jgi:hypothetical protein